MTDRPLYLHVLRSALADWPTRSRTTSRPELLSRGLEEYLHSHQRIRPPLGPPAGRRQGRGISKLHEDAAARSAEPSGGKARAKVAALHASNQLARIWMGCWT